ncbi:hypothetical protein MHU86_6827 [Fragilaria crotonensis]|nr:hypothetical protein MHU86_6827 [Fragilaria crotonensis]
MKLSFAILLLLAAESHGFSIAPAKPTTSSSLNMAFGAGEAIAITALSGVVSKMTKKREELYAAGNMGAVQSEAEAATPVSSDGTDISIPYDAAALLAYTSAGSKGDFETFKAEYLKNTIAMVIAKKVAREGGAPAPVPAVIESTPEVIDISIPYDAAALLAYTTAGSKGDFETFKAEYLKDTIAMVVAKKVAREGGAPAPVPVAVESTPVEVDISIPYDAAALLAYTTAGSKGDFETFKAEYLKDTIAMVVAKKVAREGGAPAPVPAAVETAPVEVDISIPYDAAALLAYTTAGSKGDFETFKAEYLKDTIAMVVAKKVAREGGAPAPAAVASTPEVVDISIPYDAPALLAYTAAGSKGDFETFKAEYLKSTIDMVKAKRAAVLAN